TDRKVPAGAPVSFEPSAAPPANVATATAPTTGSAARAARTRRPRAVRRKRVRDCAMCGAGAVRVTVLIRCPSLVVMFRIYLRMFESVKAEFEDPSPCSATHSHKSPEDRAVSGSVPLDGSHLSRNH